MAYPKEAPKIEIIKNEGLNNESCDAILKLLMTSIEMESRDEVYMFTIIYICQEKLKELNEVPKKKNLV